jgi:hypothetical protein
MHRWYFELQRQLLRAFMKEDHSVLTQTVLAAIEAVLSDVTAKTNGILSPMVRRDSRVIYLTRL